MTHKNWRNTLPSLNVWHSEESRVHKNSLAHETKNMQNAEHDFP